MTNRFRQGCSWGLGLRMRTLEYWQPKRCPCLVSLVLRQLDEWAQILQKTLSFRLVYCTCLHQ